MTDRQQRSDGFAAVEDRFAGYTVYDRDGDKVRKVDDLFLDESDDPGCISVEISSLPVKSTATPAVASGRGVDS